MMSDSDYNPEKGRYNNDENSVSGWPNRGTNEC